MKTAANEMKTHGCDSTRLEVAGEAMANLHTAINYTQGNHFKIDSMSVDGGTTPSD